MAFVGHLANTDARLTGHRVIDAANGLVLPFLIIEGSSALCGFTHAAWCVDFLRWARAEAPLRQRDRLQGPLGYNVESIEQLDALTDTVGPSEEPGGD